MALGCIIIISPYTPYSIYLRGAMDKGESPGVVGYIVEFRVQGSLGFKV